MALIQFQVTAARWCRAAISSRLGDLWISGIFQKHEILHVFGCFVVLSFRISTPQSECGVSAGWWPCVSLLLKQTNKCPEIPSFWLRCGCLFSCLCSALFGDEQFVAVEISNFFPVEFCHALCCRNACYSARLHYQHPMKIFIWIYRI